MDEFNWIKWAAIAFCTLVVSVAGCTAHQNYLEAGVVEKAANPAAAECAFSEESRMQSAFCLEAVKH